MGESDAVVSVSGEHSPRAVVEDVSVELALAVVQAEGCSVHTDDVSKFADDGEIFEALGVEDKGGEVTGISGSLLGLDVEAGVDDLKRADVSVLVGLVGEGCVDDNTVDVLGVCGCQ